MGIFRSSLLMEIMKATGLGKLQEYVKYVYYVHPMRLYYGAVVCWWMICVVYNISTQVAYAAGGELVAGETVAAHMSRNFLVNNNYIGVKKVALPYLSHIEGYQHVQFSSAFYHAGLHNQGWWYIPLRTNLNFGFRLGDAMITNGKEVLVLQYKAILSGNFHMDSYMSHMVTYKKSCDVLAITCLHPTSYLQASTHFMNKCIQQHMQQPEVLLTLLNANEQWGDLSTQVQNDLTQYVQLHKKLVTQKQYDLHNNAMDGHTACGGTPNTLYTAYPNTQVKQQVVERLLVNMKMVGLTKQACLLSQHKNTIGC